MRIQSNAMYILNTTLFCGMDGVLCRDQFPTARHFQFICFLSHDITILELHVANRRFRDACVLLAAVYPSDYEYCRSSINGPGALH